MIKATELRIGNLVIANGKVTTVKNIGETGINVEGWAQPIDAGGGDVYFSEAYFEDVNPIPLAPEILEKAGLVERYAKGEWSWNMNGKWDAWTEIHQCVGGYSFLSSYPPINYLHQLQNLYFALTGEELPIEL